MKIKIFISSILASCLLASHTAQAAISITNTSHKTTISNYAQTQYPIVFNHGMFGFERLSIGHIGIDYFYQILPDLKRNGAIAFASQVSPLESTEIRGEQLLQQVDEIIALTGIPKVNLIGHSHGGPTAHYVSVIAPAKVASVTGVAGSFRGSIVTDNFLSYRFPNTVINAAGQYLLGPTINLLQGSNYSLEVNRSLYSIGEKGSLAFNEKYPNAAIPNTPCGSGVKKTSDGVYHYSWTGTAQLTNLLDVADIAVSQLGNLSYLHTDHDGLINRCNTHYGQVIRDTYPHTHLDEVNQVLGLKGLFAPDPVSIFRQHANRLKSQGL